MLPDIFGPQSVFFLVKPHPEHGYTLSSLVEIRQGATVEDILVDAASLVIHANNALVNPYVDDILAPDDQKEGPNEIDVLADMLWQITAHNWLSVLLPEARYEIAKQCGESPILYWKGRPCSSHHERLSHQLEELRACFES